MSIIDIKLFFLVGEILCLYICYVKFILVNGVNFDVMIVICFFVFFVYCYLFMNDINIFIFLKCIDLKKS